MTVTDAGPLEADPPDLRSDTPSDPGTARPPDLRSTPSHSGIDGLWHCALGVGRAFTPLQELLTRTRTLSFNAQIAAKKLGAEGEPFAVVAGAVNELGEALAGLVADIESFQLAIVRGVAGYTRGEKNMTWLRSSLRTGGAPPTSAGARSTASDSLHLLGRENGAHWQARLSSTGTDDFDRELVRALMELRGQLASRLTEVSRLATSMDRATTKVGRLADLHGSFIGINARMEAMRISNGDTSLRSLGDDLHELTGDMADIVAEACAEAAELVRLTHDVVARVDPRAAADPPTH